MIKITLPDIAEGRILPDTFKVLLARGKKRQPENLFIEIYKQGTALYKNLRLRCNLQSYDAQQSNLCDVQAMRVWLSCRLSSMAWEAWPPASPPLIDR